MRIKNNAKQPNSTLYAALCAFLYLYLSTKFVIYDYLSVHSHIRLQSLTNTQQ